MADRIEDFVFTLRYTDGKKRKELSFPVYSPLSGDGIKTYVRMEELDCGTRFAVSITPERSIVLSSAGISGRVETGESIWVNGYQSWTESRDYTPKEHMSGFRPIFFPWVLHYKLSQYGDASFVQRPLRRGHFYSFSMTGSRRGDSIDFWGSLAERDGFTIFSWNVPKGKLSVSRDVKGLSVDSHFIVLDLFIASGREDEVMDAYVRLLSLPKRSVKPATGYTSWYNLYNTITQESILRDLAAFTEQNIPLDFFQIDDGWERAVGDWLIPNGKFPEGMKPIALSIKKAGYRPGLWLAPFIVEESSLLRVEHPDWILKDRKGRPVVAGNNPFIWSGYSYSLDIYHPEVQEYLARVFDTIVHQWGFEMLKLDFLYAACIIPRWNKSRGRVMSDAMRFLRDISGGAVLLGCGMPLASGFGYVDYCRIGSDVGLSWEDRRLKAVGYRERVSTINSITSTIGRQSFNGRFFLSDPDVFILRPENNRLTAVQRQTLFYVNEIFGGLVFTSDNISSYDDEVLAFYRASFPFKKKRICELSREGRLLRVVFAVDKLQYCAFINLSPKPAKLRLSPGLYYHRDSGFLKGDTVLSLSAYETRSYLSVGGDEFSLAGSTAHVFPCSEISQFSLSAKGLTIALDEQVLDPGFVFVRIPQNMAGIPVNGVTHHTEDKCGLNLLILDERELPRTTA